MRNRHGTMLLTPTEEGKVTDVIRLKGNVIQPQRPVRWPRQAQRRSKLKLLGDKTVKLSAIGSVASILGLLVSLYVLWRELRLQRDMTALKDEEEEWHDKGSKK